MDERQENLSKLRLSEAGYRKLAPHFPPQLKGYALYGWIALMEGAALNQKTVCRIIERRLPVTYYSLANLFAAFGLELQDADYESHPSGQRGSHKHYHVPYKLNEWFTGRTQELGTLRALLKTNNVVALGGLGGLGKTQTALAYCERYKANYDFVFWIRADSDADIQQGYAEIARCLQLPGAALPEAEQAASAMRWLDKHFGWLLVLDNLDAPKNGKSYWPNDPPGHILLTTRAGQLSLLTNTIPLALGTLSPQESLQFFLNRCKRAATAGEERAAAELAAKLGYLPLAMEQAAAYIASMTTTFAHYLALYNRRQLAQLARSAPATGNRPDTVQTTWEINFQAVEKEAQRNGTAGMCSPELLKFCAFLAPDDIPLDLVRCGSKEYCPALHTLFQQAEDEAEAEEIYNEVLEPLTRYSLVVKNLEARTFGLHRLVQAVTRDRLADKQREWQERAVRAVAAAFPVPEIEEWPLCERLLPHALAVGEMIFQEKIATIAAGDLLDKAGRYLFLLGRYAPAETYYLAALEIWREIHQGDHPQIAVSMNNLGLLRLHQRRPEEAEALFKQALAIRRSLLPDSPLDIAECLNDVAGVYDCQGRWEEAEPLYREALEMTRLALPQSNQYLAIVLNNLGLLCYRQQRRAEAEDYYTQALTIWRDSRPSDHPMHATCRHNLAQLYRKQSRMEEAEPLYRQALGMQKNLYLDGHPDIAITHHNMGQMYETLGCLDDAEEHYKQALETTHKALGEDHPDFAEDQQALAAFYARHGRDNNTR